MDAFDYDRRIELLRQQLAEHECDAFFSVSPPDNAYLTGFFGSTSGVLITREEALLLCDFRYAEQASLLTSGATPVICKGSFDHRLGEHLMHAGVKQAAFDPGCITVSKYDTIKSAFPGSLKPVPELCRKLREIKEPAEVNCIRAASRLAEESLECVLGTVKCGMRENEFAAALEFEFRKRGAQGPSFDTIVLFGARSSLPHGKPGPKSLEIGDIVLVDCGCVLEGYCSDLTRTFVFGRIPGSWFSDIYAYVYRAQSNALNSVCSGANARDVDRAARVVIESAGYGLQFGHGTGHAVGLEVHENPRLNAESDSRLASGMVITVEPGIYIPGQGGVRIEDLVSVTDDGSEVLTLTSKELRIL